MTSNVAPRRPSGGNQLRADRTRALVIDETVRCVLEEGFAAASAKRITERLGVTWGVIQYHFGDRDGMLMAVVDQGVGDLESALADLRSRLPSVAGRDRIELVVNSVAQAFLGPTSVAALEILLATRIGRSQDDRKYLANAMPMLTDLGRLVAEGLERDRADMLGNLIWTTLSGAMLANLAMEGPVDMSRELRALTDVIAVYVEQRATN